MTLESGVRLGPYAISSAIGAGGMGEVYRAHDSRLGRDVAIKVLPASFSSDPERLQRFEREARSAAALNHPNILAVYDLGQHDGSPYIVSELLEGATLRERLDAGALPVRKTVECSIQIANGLAAAHDKGIVHRDLKPENVFVTPDGRVKILDFGLAKLAPSEPSVSAIGAAPTTLPDTTPGVMLGTFGYMAPEQVRGLVADHRSDVFAFGATLYEMLSGRRAFRGATTADTMSSILNDDPPELPVLERQIPPALARIVSRCLEKDPVARFQSCRDLAFALEALSSHSDAAPTEIPARGRAPADRERAAWALVAVLLAALVAAAAAGVAMFFSRRPPSLEATRFFISPPQGWTLAMQNPGGPTVGPVAVSPDGRQVAFVGQDGNGNTLIWLRSLDTLQARALSGTEGGRSPFWSPDSRSLAFFADGKLKRVEISGGPPVSLCDAMPGISGTWSPAGVIVFSPAGGTPLQKVAASGGVPAAATVFDVAKGETGHARPLFLPDGRHFLYRLARAAASRGPVFLASIDSMERTELLEIDSTNVAYSQGHLLFLRERTLMAQPFDLDRLSLSGNAVPVAEQIQTFGVPAYGFFSATDGGVLAYQTGAAGIPQLAWFDRSGTILSTVGKPAMYGDLELTRDGTRALVTLADQSSFDVWHLDLQRDGLPSRLTVDPGQGGSPIWSPDGTQVAYSSSRTGVYDLYRKSASGLGPEEPLLAIGQTIFASSWSADGRFLLYTQNKPGADTNVWVLPMSGDGKPFPFLDTPASEWGGRFSPDGRWIAYVSDESGRAEVYVARFEASGTAPTAKWQVSANGGNHPRWHPDGGEIFYMMMGPNATVMAAPVRSQTGSRIEIGTVTPLFTVRRPPTPASFLQIAPDGQRFLVNTAPDAPADTAPIAVVVNWAAGLNR